MRRTHRRRRPVSPHWTVPVNHYHSRTKPPRLPPITSSRSVWISLIFMHLRAFLARLPSPQVCCRLFLNSCYSRATACAWNIKRSGSLRLLPSPTAGDGSHRHLASRCRAACTSVECKSKRALKGALSSCMNPQSVCCLFCLSLSLSDVLCPGAERSSLSPSCHGKAVSRTFHWAGSESSAVVSQG